MRTMITTRTQFLKEILNHLQADYGVKEHFEIDSSLQDGFSHIKKDRFGNTARSGFSKPKEKNDDVEVVSYIIPHSQIKVKDNERFDEHSIVGKVLDIAKEHNVKTESKLDTLFLHFPNQTYMLEVHASKNPDEKTNVGLRQHYSFNM